MEIVKCFVVYSGPSINRTLYLLMAIFCKICVHITRLNLFSVEVTVYISMQIKGRLHGAPNKMIIGYLPAFQCVSY